MVAQSNRVTSFVLVGLSLTATIFILIVGSSTFTVEGRKQRTEGQGLAGVEPHTPIYLEDEANRDRINALVPSDEVAIELEHESSAEDAEATLLLPEDGSPARPGVVRVMGTVIDSSSGAPIRSIGATMRVFELQPGEPGPWGNRPLLLATAQVVGDGSFRCDLMTYLGRSFSEERDPIIRAHLSAPGYGSFVATKQLSKFADGVWLIRARARAGGVLATGFVVDENGSPVAGADVKYVRWGFEGSVEGDGETKTDGAGYFDLALDRARFANFVAFHPSFGDSRTEVSLSENDAQVDLGTLVLSTRGVLEGVVVGYGDRPLPFWGVEIQPADDSGNHVAAWMETDLSGAFRFATADAVPYQLRVERAPRREVQLPTYLPDQHGLVLRLERPQIFVTITDPYEGGEGLRELSCVAIDEEGRPIQSRGAVRKWSDQRLLPDGRYSVLFGEPGRYALGTARFLDGVRLAATSFVDLGSESRDVELRLAPEQTAPIRLEVVGSSGEPALEWSVEFEDLSTRLKVGACAADHPIAHLAPGRYVAKVDRLAHTLPFSVEFEVLEETESEPQLVQVQGGVAGGRIAVAVRSLGSDKGDVSVKYATKGERPKVSGLVRAVIDGPYVEVDLVLPVGEYSLQLYRSGSAKQRELRHVDSILVGARELTRHVLQIAAE